MDQCYEDRCKYVHFSDAHFHHVQGRTEDGKFRLQIGGGDRFALRGSWGYPNQVTPASQAALASGSLGV
jgi:hypothetical protein